MRRLFILFAISRKTAVTRQIGVAVLITIPAQHITAIILAADRIPLLPLLATPPPTYQLNVTRIDRAHGRGLRNERDGIPCLALPVANSRQHGQVLI